jgi:hypothetical protein
LPGKKSIKPKQFGQNLAKHTLGNGQVKWLVSLNVGMPYLGVGLLLQEKHDHGHVPRADGEMERQVCLAVRRQSRVGTKKHTKNFNYTIKF